MAMSVRTMAHALMTTPEPFCPAKQTGCTPQYPPSKKYKSTDAGAEASRKWALTPTHRSLLTQVRVAGLVRFDQRPVALIKVLARKHSSRVVSLNGPVPSAASTVHSA